MDNAFLMASTSSITVQSLGKIVQRAPAVGAKMWCLSLCLPAGLPQSGKLPVLNLLTGRKSGFSPRMGDLLHRFRSNFAGPTGTWVRLAVQNFTSITTGGWECGPKNVKNFHFFRLDALALSVIATATWLAGWLAGCVAVCHSRYCIKTTKPIRKLFEPSGRRII